MLVVPVQLSPERCDLRGPAGVILKEIDVRMVSVPGSDRG